VDYTQYNRWHLANELRQSGSKHARQKYVLRAIVLSSTCTSSDRHCKDVQTRFISLLLLRSHSSYPSRVHILKTFYLRSGSEGSPLQAEYFVLITRVPKSDQHALLLTQQFHTLIKHGFQFHITSSPLAEGSSLQVLTHCTANTALFMYFTYLNAIIRFTRCTYNKHETVKGQAKR
jgi:hypothetical protein